MTANMVPVWSMTSSSVIGGEAGSSPISFSATTTCAELDTGSSSASPCTTASTMILSSVIRRVLPLQQVPQILQRKSRQRHLASARERHELERLAHLLGHDQAARFAREACVRDCLPARGYQPLETEPEEEGRLGGETPDLEPRGVRCVRDARE